MHSKIVYLAVLIFIISSLGCSAPTNSTDVRETNKSKPEAKEVNSPNGKTLEKPAQEATKSENVFVYLANENADGLTRTLVESVETTNPVAVELSALLQSDKNHSPKGTRLLNMDIVNGMAIVDLNKQFEEGGGTTSVTLRVAEIVFTLTERKDVDSVKIIIEGQDVEYITGEGYMVKDPLFRENFADLKISE